MLSRTDDRQATLFHFVMIKPTHYDDDGYPIQWFRSAIPSNTLACLNALAEDARRREVLGSGVEIRLHTHDETNCRVRPDRITRMIRRTGGRALIGLVGVQSNQFPRAVDLARQFTAAGLPVSIGGFHISGCTSMLPELPRDIRDAQSLGISFFAGEAKPGVLMRCCATLGTARSSHCTTTLKGSARARRRAGADPAEAARAAHLRVHCRASTSAAALSLPVLILYHYQRTGPQEPLPHAPTIWKKIVRENYAQGIKRFFITDDNFARNRD
jgi:hypothetical protein